MVSTVDNLWMDARLMPPEDVTQHLLERAAWTASRSSGPGGQRRDKVSTRAEMELTANALEGLPAEVADHLLVTLRLDQGPLRLANQDQRLLSQNQARVAARLLEIVEIALEPPPPPRRPTRPSRSARQARVDTKTQRGVVKRLRGRPAGDD